MSDTNFNNSGLGAQPGWGQSTGMPQTDGMSSAIQTDGENFTVSDDDVVWKDAIVQALVPDAKLDSDIPKTPYVTYADRPNLPQATVNDPQLAQKTLGMLHDTSPEAIQKFIDQFQAILPAPTTPEIYKQYSDVAVNDPEINKLAQETGLPPGVVEKNAKDNLNQTFTLLVENQFPEEIATKLKFAFYVPEGAKNLSPELKEKLATLTQTAMNETAVSFGFSKTWQGVSVDASEFKLNLSLEVDTAFEKLLGNLLGSGTITEADAKTLRSMHYEMATGTPTLRNLLKQLEGQATTQLQAKYGFDVSYQPTGEAVLYNNIVNGDFAQTFQKNVAKYTGTPTEEQRKLMTQHAPPYDPKDPSLPEPLKKYAAQLILEKKQMLMAFPDFSGLEEPLKTSASTIFAVSKATIIEKYGLDISWNPTITSLFAPGIDPLTIQRANAGVAMVLEALENAKKIANDMPAGPEKLTFLNFLKAIGEAIAKIQESIYAMQAEQSVTSKAMNRAKLDMQLNDIEKQQRAADEVKEKVKKMAAMGPLGKIFMWIIKIIMLIIGVLMGPLAFALALTYFVDSAITEATHKKDSMIQLMFKEISKSLPPAAAAAINGIIAVTISMYSLNPLLAMNIMFQDSRVIQDIVKTFGGSAMAQEMAAMITMMIAMLALMIVLIIVSGGAATAALVPVMAKKLSEVAHISIKAATLAINISRWTFQSAIAGLVITMESIKMNNNILLSQVDIIKGEAEAYSEIIQGIITQLKKVIKVLMDLLGDNTDQLVTISNFQGKKWSDAAQITSNLIG